MGARSRCTLTSTSSVYGLADVPSGSRAGYSLEPVKGKMICLKILSSVPVNGYFARSPSACVLRVFVLGRRECSICAVVVTRLLDCPSDETHGPELILDHDSSSSVDRLLFDSLGGARGRRNGVCDSQPLVRAMVAAGACHCGSNGTGGQAITSISLLIQLIDGPR